MAVLKNSVVVAFWTAASRGLGFARDLLIANKLGATGTADAFFVALMLPNLFRRLFAEGAFNVAFVPILGRHKGTSEAAALEFASATFSWLLVIVSTVCVVGVLAMPALVMILASGFAHQPEKFALAVELGRITFPYLGLITVAAFLGALCNTFGKFAAYAMVPAFLNLSILLCLFVLPIIGNEPVFAAAWAIPLGGVAQVAYMFWAARRLGLRLNFSWLPQHADLKPLLQRMGPAALGVGVLQLSLVVDNGVASYLSDGAISFLQYANRFYQLPMALIGTAVATVLLPHLAVLLGAGDKQAATKSFTNAFSGCLALGLGSAVGLILLAPEMMLTLLQHGEFTQQAAYFTAWVMMAYVLGLPAYIVTKVTAPALFAAEDPTSPVKASAIALGVNFVLNVIFVVLAKTLEWDALGIVGIGLATAAGGYVNAYLQWHWLTRRGILTIDKPALRQQVQKMLLVSGALALVLGAVKLLVPYAAEGDLLDKLVWLSVTGSLGLAVFVGGIHVSGLLDLRQVWQARRQKRALVGPDGKPLKLSDDGGL